MHSIDVLLAHLTPEFTHPQYIFLGPSLFCERLGLNKGI